jgi:hypothetical protein
MLKCLEQSFKHEALVVCVNDLIAIYIYIVSKNFMSNCLHHIILFAIFFKYFIYLKLYISGILFLFLLLLLLLNKRYNSCRVLAFLTVCFHSWRSWACSVHLRSFIFLRSFLTSSSHLCLGLPTGQVIYGCHLYILQC